MYEHHVLSRGVGWFSFFTAEGVRGNSGAIGRCRDPNKSTRIPCGHCTWVGASNLLLRRSLQKTALLHAITSPCVALLSKSGFVAHPNTIILDIMGPPKSLSCSFWAPVPRFSSLQVCGRTTFPRRTPRKKFTWSRSRTPSKRR